MKLLFTALCSLLLLTASAQQYDALKTTSYPVSGKRLTIAYSAESTLLSAAREVSGRIYFYNSLGQRGEEKISLEKSGKAWKGTVKLPDSILMLSFVFTAEDGKLTDNNKNKGYLFPVYKDGKPVQFAYSTMAGLVGGGPLDAAKLKKDQSQALAFMKEEMRVHPESERKLRSGFYNLLANSPEREDKVFLLARLNALKSDQEDELMMAQLYLSYFGGKRQADSLDRLLLTKFPDGKYVKEKKRMAERAAQQSTPAAIPAAQIKKTAVEKDELLKEVAANLIDEPVGAITLKDINGNNVTLGAGDLKGKVIVLDFWATWCKPCIASFPAMQRVMTQYQDNPAVKFFFINTMEQGDAVKNVKAFMAKNPYPFTVLMDEKTADMNLYKAYSNYRATGGIPVKLVIDGRGHVRARATGFSGSDEGLMIELSAMIDAALKSGR